MKIAVVSLLYFILLSSSLLSQPAVIWQKSYGGSDNDYGNALIKSRDGNFIIAGAHNSIDGDVSSPMSLAGSDYWLVKIDSLGSIIWEKSYGGIGPEDTYSICETLDHGFVLGGQALFNDGQVSGTIWAGDFWIVKVDSVGNFIWASCLGSTGRDVLSEVYQTRDSGFIVCGTIDGDAGNVTTWFGSFDFWIIKLNVNGGLMWQRTVGGIGGDFCNSIKELTDGSFLVSGSVSGNSNFPGNHGSDDIVVVKLNSTGNIVWQKCYGGSSSDYRPKVISDSNTGFFLAGSTISNDGDISGNHGVPDFWILHCDSAGNIDWSECFGSINIEELADFKLTNDGGLIAVGSIKIGLLSDFIVMKIDVNHNLEWTTTLGGSNNDKASSVLEISPGKYLITGITNSYDGDVSFNHDSTTYDIWTIMLSDISVGTSGIITEQVYDFNILVMEGVLNTRFSSHINKEVQMEVYNIAGQKVAEQNVRIKEGINNFTLPGNFKAGSYCLKIGSSGFMQSKMFVVVGE